MRYVSTNGRARPVAFREAALRGTAEDGGLYLPERIPALAPEVWERGGDVAFAETALAVAHAFLHEDFTDDELRAIVADAFTFAVPLVALEPSLHVLELFHGPTLAFKDVGARFMARVFSRLRRDTDAPLTVLVATSGDTGGAVAAGFHNVAGVRVVLLYPAGRVSETQERQMTTLGGNITAVALDGSFDDCQRLVKRALGDADLRGRLALTSANSINIARLIPQVFYYVHAYTQLSAHPRERALPVVCAVPSGNFGNLTAGLIARQMGLPIAHFIAATNANAIVPEYLTSGMFQPRPSLPTLSSAMDVGDPSNFARMLALSDHDVERMCRDITGSSASDDETLAAMRRIYERHGYVADPHTAVAYAGLERFRAAHVTPCQGIVLATAHPAKFPETVRAALGIEPDLPERLRACLDRPKHVAPLDNDFAALRRLLLDENEHGGTEETEATQRRENEGEN
jgi:threonine synthase